MNILLIILLTILICVLNFFLNKYNFLLSYTGDKHQKFTTKEKIPLTGGIFLLICFFLIFFNNFALCFSLTLLFLLGLSSDLKKLNSPKFRFMLQLIILLSSIYFLNLEIKNTRIILLDSLLYNNFFSYFFVVFCVLILVNGTNFIDGLNTNVLGYYLIVSFFIFSHDLYELLEIERKAWLSWIFCLSLLYLLNFFKQLFIGDSGAYFLGFLYAYFLIEIFSIDSTISPFFIILLLWYPCFEILFSIIRKINFNKSPLRPDNRHFHQVVYLFIKKLTRKNKINSNTLSANIINFYNLIIIFLGSLNINNSQYQIFLIIISIILYIFIYLRIRDTLNK